MGGIYEVNELFDKVGKNRRRWETRNYLASLRHLWQIFQIKNSYQLLYNRKDPENRWNAKTYLPIVCHLWQIIQIPNWLSIENVSQDKSPIWMGGSKKLPPPISSKLQPFFYFRQKFTQFFPQRSNLFIYTKILRGGRYKYTLSKKVTNLTIFQLNGYTQKPGEEKLVFTRPSHLAGSSQYKSKTLGSRYI